jgi:hypothetical protein
MPPVLDGFAGFTGIKCDDGRGWSTRPGRYASWLYLLLAIALPSKCREDTVGLGRHVRTLVWCTGCTQSLWLFCVFRCDSPRASAACLGHRTQSTKKTEDVSGCVGSFWGWGEVGKIEERGNTLLT